MPDNLTPSHDQADACPDRPRGQALRRLLAFLCLANDVHDHDPPEDVAAALEWVAGHSRPLADLADRDLVLDALDAIATRLDGTPAAANTVARKRAVLSNVLDYAVGRGLEANPLATATKVWTAPTWKPASRVAVMSS